MEENIIYRKTIEIGTSDLDSERKLRFDSLYNFLLLAADEHSIALDWGIISMIERGISWMLLKFRIKVHDYPAGRQMVSVETWPSGGDSRYATREFRLFKGNSKDLIAEATSSWMIIDLDRGRPLRIDDVIKRKWAINEQRTMEDVSLPVIDKEKPLFERDFPVRYVDIDMLNHVTNARYIDIIIESVPENVLVDKRITELEVEFRNQAVFGDVIKSRAYGIDEVTRESFYHSLTKDDSIQVVKALTRRGAI